MIIFLEEITAQLIIWVLKFLDILLSIFKSIVGINEILVQGENVNIFEYLFSNTKIESIFICLVILAGSLAIIFSVISIIRIMITSKGSVLGVLGKFLSSIISMLIMMAFVYIIILIFVSLLEILQNIFLVGSGVSIPNSILSSLIPEYVNGYTESEIDINNVTVHELLGDYEFGVVFPERWAYNGMVNPDSFLYLPGIICSLFIIIGIVICLIKLTKSIYEIILIYLLLPLSLSSLPLDDGERFRNWRDCFFSRLLTFVSAIFSINFLVIILPLLLKVHISTSTVVDGVFRLILVTSGCLLLLSASNIFERVFIPNVTLTDVSGGVFTRALREMYRYSIGIPYRIGSTAIRARRVNKLRERTK